MVHHWCLNPSLVEQIVGTLHGHLKKGHGYTFIALVEEENGVKELFVFNLLFINLWNRKKNITNEW